MADLEKLTAPFPITAIKQRAGGNRMLSYVEGHSVIHRLNDATGNVWDMTVRSITSQQFGNNTLMIAHVALTLPGHGTREGLGVQMVHERGGEDLVKGAITDGLKKAATLFGVGLELYGPDYEAGEVAAQQNTRVAQQQAPPRPPQQQRPTPARDALRPVVQDRTTDGINQEQLKAIANLWERTYGKEDIAKRLQADFGAESTDVLSQDQAAAFIQALGKEYQLTKAVAG